jgi:hypothetical protein
LKEEEIAEALDLLLERSKRIFEEEKKKLRLENVRLYLDLSPEALRRDYKYRRALKVSKGLPIRKKILGIFTAFIPSVITAIKEIKKGPEIENVEIAALKLKDGSYEVYFNGLRYLISERVFRRHCKHELYHIAKGHLEREKSGWRSVFQYLLSEVATIFYERFRSRE